MDVAMRYFFETVACGSMQAASGKLGVSVSSISRQVAQLEHNLGILLIERNRRTIRLTEAGRILLDYHRDGIAERGSLIEQIDALRGARSGKVSIAVGEGFLGGAFIEVIDTFQAANPGVEISITVESTIDAVRHVLEDEVHVAFVFQSPAESRIRVLASVAQPLLVACHPHHPLVACKSITLRELEGHNLALPPRATRIRQLLAVAEATRQIWLRPRITSNSIYTLRELAKAGRIVTVLPKVSFLADLQEGSLLCLPIAEPELETTDMAVISRVGRQLSGAAAIILPLLEARLVSFR